MAGAYGWKTYHLHVPTVYKLRQPQHPGALRACPGLYRDSFNFLLRERSGKWFVLCKYCAFQKLHRNAFAMRMVIFSWGYRTTSYTLILNAKVHPPRSRSYWPASRFGWFNADSNWPQVGRLPKCLDLKMLALKNSRTSGNQIPSTYAAASHFYLSGKVHAWKCQILPRQR